MSLRWAVLLGLLSTSAWLAWTGSKNASTQEVVAAVPRQAAVAAARPLAGREAASQPSPFLAVLMHRSADDPPGGVMAADPFAVRDWAPIQPAPAAVASAPAGPTVPANPFSYLGKQRSDAGWEVFLARGDQVTIVREGSLFDGDTYRVDSIKPPALTLTYMPLAATQTMSIGGDE